MNYALEFSFNGIHTSTFGVYKVKVDSGMVEENYFLANKTVNSYKLKYDIHAHKTSINKEPLVIPLVLWFNGDVDEEKEQEIKRWLETDDFCKLQFDDSKYHYNAMLNGQVKFVHDSNSDGYVELEFITDSPYRFSDEITPSGQSISDTEYKTVKLNNDGDIVTYPTIEIIAPGASNGIEINNITTQQRFVLSGSYTDLTINIINEYEELHTEGNFTNLYENHNGIFIGLKRGSNELQMKGQFYYKIIYQNIYL